MDDEIESIATESAILYKSHLAKRARESKRRVSTPYMTISTAHLTFH